MPEFNNIAILGAGLMGHGLAVVHALGGCGVRLHDLAPQALENAEIQIASALKTLTGAKAISADEAKAAVSRIEYCSGLATALKDCDMVVEAIAEDMEVKRRLYGEIENLLPPHAVFASNTSYLDIFQVLPNSLRERSFILHWYTPPYIIDLVDVVPGAAVPEALTARVIAFIEGLGKKPVRFKQFISGYIANRIQMAIESEIFRLLDEGVADIEAIDTSIRYGLALRLAILGQFRKIDYTGLRIVRDSHHSRVYDPPTHPTGTPELDRLLRAGREGVAKGAGFYDYHGQQPAHLYRKRDLDLLTLKATMKAIERP